LPSQLVRSSRSTVRALRGLLAAALAVPALLYAVAAWQSREVLFEEAADRAQKTAGILQQHATATFQLYEQVFDRIEDHLETVGETNLAALHSFLARLDKQLEQIDSIFVVDADGRVVSHSRTWPMPDGVFAGDRDYFLTLRPAGSGPVSVGEPIAGRLSGKPRLNIAHRRTLPNGGFGGVIAISVSQGYFEDFHQTLRAATTDAMTLIRDDGAILARSPATPGSKAYPADSFQRALATTDEGTYRTTSRVDGVDRIYAYRKLAGYPVYVAYGLDTAGVLGRWRHNLAIYGAIAAPAELVLFAVTWIALVRARREEAAALRLEAEMRQRESAEDALRQAQKMEAVGQLTGGVAHDFNNLLTVAVGNIELAAGMVGSSVVRQRLEAGLKALQRGQQLTGRLLTFARRRPLKTVVVDLRRKLPELAELIEPSIGRQVSLTVEAAPDVWPVEVDDGELQIALLNLAINARDAMSGGGKVRISARNLALPIRERPPALRDLAEELVTVTVADEGQGIPPELLARIFEPFFTTKSEGKGSGLGLAQVYGFAKQSNGAVTIESEVDRGTSVTLYLPRAADAATTKAAGGAAAAPAPSPADAERWEAPNRGGLGRILVVEDDADVAEMAAASLERLGYRVTVADRARRALEILADDPRYDLVFSDIVMPDGMSGLDLADEIERRHPDVPLLLTTGYAAQERLATADRDVLPKPYAIDQLKAAIEARLRKSPPAADDD
jgi:two-component system, NtrC family, sensor kinase